MDTGIRDEILAKRNQIPKWVIYLFLGIAIVGFGTFALNASGENAKDIWLIFLVNFLFWTGVAQGGIVFSCILRITDARWGRSFLRISEGFGAFVPVGFILLLVLVFLGKDYVLPYATEQYHHPKDIWLNMTFVQVRNIILFAILIVLSYAYVRISLNQDLVGNDNTKKDNGYFPRLRTLAPAIVIFYAITFSFFAWDFMMSLNPHWFSTLFGPFYFMGSLIAAIGATIILSVVLKRYIGLDDYLGQYHYWDMGKILQGFSLFWVYLMFSQFLPIWYANMPEETGFVIKRVVDEPFKTFSWAVLTCCFIFPFVAFIPRTNKIVTPILVFIAAVSFTGLFMDKFLLVVPSLTDQLSFSIKYILVTLGFLGTFLATFLLFINKYPIIPYGDPFFDGKTGHGGHH